MVPKNVKMLTCHRERIAPCWCNSPTTQPLYETRGSWTAAPRDNEIRASEKKSWKFVAKPFTNFNIFENFEFLKFRCHATACLVTYNCLVSQRRSVRSRQDQTITNWSWSILAVFEINRFQESRTPENTENAPPAHRHPIQRFTLVRYPSTV